MKNETILLIDRTLSIQEIERNLETQISDSEKRYLEKIEILNKEEQEYIKHYQDKISETQDEIRKLQEQLQIADEYEKTSLEWFIKFNEENLQEYYDNMTQGYEGYKQNALSDFNTKKENVVLVFDVSKLGINDTTFNYAVDIIRKYNASHSKAKVSFKLLADDVDISGELPILISTSEVKKLLNFREYIAKEQLSKNNDLGLRQLAGENDCSIDSVINANALVKKVADEVKTLNLTPFEASLYVHKFCTQFYYNSVYQKSPRMLESIVENGGIVCVGYASLFKAICDKANVPGLKVELNTAVRHNLNGGHANCRVSIDDPAYNVKGVYMEDPCYNAQSYDRPYSFSTCLYSLGDIDTMHNAYYYNFNHNAKDYFESNLDSIPREGSLDTRPIKEVRITHKAFVQQGESETIPLDTYRIGLMNMAYKSGAKPEEAIAYAEEKIEHSIQDSVYLYKKGSANEFYKEAKNRNLRRKRMSREERDAKSEAEQTYPDRNKQFIDEYLRK